MSEPIFKQQESSQDRTQMFQAREDRLQNCNVDKTGKYHNVGGTCAEECFEEQTLVIYDWNEGFCCCAYIEKTPNDSLSCDTLIESKLQENTKLLTKIIVKAFPKFLENIFSLSNSSKSIENCMKDETGKYLNLEGSCKGNCMAGTVAIIYDSINGFCCCSNEYNIS